MNDILYNTLFFREKELHIHNTDGQQQTTILREDLPGFIFESNRGTKHSFTAETFLGNLHRITLHIKM